MVLLAGVGFNIAGQVLPVQWLEAISDTSVLQ
jgi:hypothetical protein